ncbi:MAG: Holliday junction branch migration protein RuvA [bacterium]
MIYSISGKLIKKEETFIVLNVGGVGIKVYVPRSFFDSSVKRGATITLFTHLHVRDGIIDLYGFLKEQERVFFESLISVSGVGPKSAMSILNTSTVERLSAAVSEGDVALFQKTSGIGRKTAERIILELKEKITFFHTEETVGRMKVDSDVFEALVGLGYPRGKVREVISKIDKTLKTTDERLRDALQKIKE